MRNLTHLRMHNQHSDSRGSALRSINPLGSRTEIRRLGVRDVNEGLRIQVGEREPRALYLHHDAMSAAKGVVDIRHLEADLFLLSGNEGLGMFKALAELSAHR